MAYKVCPDSLGWILRYRAAIRVAPHASDHELDQMLIQDGHSGWSFMWTRAQSQYIDEHGFEAWLNSPAAQGYSHEISKIFNSADAFEPVIIRPPPPPYHR